MCCNTHTLIRNEYDALALKSRRRREAAIKSWVTRRRNLAKKAQVVDDLTPFVVEQPAPATEAVPFVVKEVTNVL
jgi:hypothetical protein